MTLHPIPTAEVDPRIAQHLASSETVLWQGHPKEGTFFGPKQFVGAAVLVGFAIFLVIGGTGMLAPSKATYTLASVSVLGALVVLAQGWHSRAARWAYAITDRRLMSAHGDKLIRSVPPELLDRHKLRIAGDTVYWYRYSQNNRQMGTDFPSGPEGRKIGFHGQSDPQATMDVIMKWREAISQDATAQASAFVAARNTGEDVEIGPAAGVQRVRHPQTGLTCDVPQGWEVTVRKRTDGPLQVFGVTLLPRIIREGDPKPYGTTDDWNAITVRGAPEAGLDIAIYHKMPDVTLEQVTSDRWLGVTGVTLRRTDPDLRIGGMSGFGVLREMPAGFKAKNVEALSGALMERQLWLSKGGLSVEVTGFALESQPEIQSAVDAMIDSLRLAD
jgi:hypothetical protein